MPEIAGQVADGFADAVREHEEQWLSPLAVRSYETRGREAPEEECRLRTPFQRDRDRIVHSKAFRRLRHKTQVFVDPEGDHFRTRLTHTLEAAGIARGVARALRLNEDLTEAIRHSATPESRHSTSCCASAAATGFATTSTRSASSSGSSATDAAST
jgi:dGTPase